MENKSFVQKILANFNNLKIKEKFLAVKANVKIKMKEYFRTPLMIVGMILFIVVAFYAGTKIQIFKNRQTTSQKAVYPTGNQYGTSPLPTSEPDLTLRPEVVKNAAPGKLAFVSEGEIWTIRGDRTEKMQITNDKFNKFGITISSDNNKIAYSFYPKDQNERTNQGYYVGYNSGVEIVDLATKKSSILIPYGSIQNHYATFSPDSKYLSIWIGNGVESKLIEVDTGKSIIVIAGEERVQSNQQLSAPFALYQATDPKKTVSPIVWIPKSSRISYVVNGGLIASSPDGSNKEKLAEGGIEAFRGAHEGSNIPLPPSWSESGRYVTYYKNSGLYLLDTVNKTEVLIGKGGESDFGGRYPKTYVAGYSKEENYIYLLEYGDNIKTISKNIATGETENIPNLGQSMVFSPNNDIVFGLINEGYTYAKIGIYSIPQKSMKECPTGFRHSYYSWSGGFGFQSKFAVWSPDNTFVVGQEYPPGSITTLRILNTTNCETYDLVKGTALTSVVWFSN